MMPNMSYCRFTNTRSDLNDCLDSLRCDERLSKMETHAGRNMFKEFLTFCGDYDIISGYDGEMLDALFDGLRKKEDSDE